jgi:hypothetical protein
MSKHLYDAVLMLTLCFGGLAFASADLSSQVPSTEPNVVTSTAAEESDIWGGEHIEITIGGGGGEVQFDCASGTIATSLNVAAQGKFQADGTYKREHGGPVRKDESDAVAAKYSGSISGNTMHLDIVLAESKESVGSYVLTRGQAGKVFKCR